MQFTSRHEIVPENRHPEIPSQRGQRGPDSWESFGESRGLGPEVAEGTKAEYAVGVVAKDVVPAGQEVVGLNELGEQTDRQTG